MMPGLVAVAVNRSADGLGAADVLEQFRLTDEDAQQSVFDTLWQGTPDAFGPAPSIFRTLSPAGPRDGRDRGGGICPYPLPARATRFARRTPQHGRRDRRNCRTPPPPVSTVDKQTAEMQKAMAATKENAVNVQSAMKKWSGALEQAGAARHGHGCADGADLQKQE